MVPLKKRALDLRGYTPKPVFGHPVNCPDCGGVGVLDRIDVARRVMHEHCVRCHRTFSFSETQIHLLRNPLATPKG